MIERGEFKACEGSGELPTQWIHSGKGRIGQCPSCGCLVPLDYQFMVLLEHGYTQPVDET
jgi:hypothetical protein